MAAPLGSNWRGQGYSALLGAILALAAHDAKAGCPDAAHWLQTHPLAIVACQELGIDHGFALKTLGLDIG